MVLQMADAVYTLSFTAAEREQLLVALELAVATRRGEPERGALIVDVDPDLADRLCDVLFLTGAPA